MKTMIAMQGKCTMVTTCSIEDIINGTPAEHLAMFRVSSSQDESLLGEMVYIHRGRVYDCMSDTRHDEVRAENLHFVGYKSR